MIDKDYACDFFWVRNINMPQYTLLRRSIISFVIGYIVGIVAVTAHNMLAPPEKHSEIHATALSTALIVLGVPLVAKIADAMVTTKVDLVQHT